MLELRVPQYHLVVLLHGLVAGKEHENALRDFRRDVGQKLQKRLHYGDVSLAIEVQGEFFVGMEVEEVWESEHSQLLLPSVQVWLYGKFEIKLVVQLIFNDVERGESSRGQKHTFGVEGENVPEANGRVQTNK